jgi:hypothetical protein
MMDVNLIASYQASQARISRSGSSPNGFSVTGMQKSRIDISISVDQQPLTLAYQAAIDQINEAVEPYLGEQAIQRGYNSGLDVSPEATADRIVGLSTSLFHLFKDQHPDMGQEPSAVLHKEPSAALHRESVVTKFIEVLKSGVEQGFGEAREILDGLGVLEGEIASNIDKTFDLVMEGLDAFGRRMLNAPPIQSVN